MENLSASNLTNDQFLVLEKFLKRQDQCKFIMDLYNKVLNIIKNKGTIYEATDFLIHSINDLLDGKIPIDDLVITKTVGVYLTDSHPMHLFCEKLRSSGMTINVDDKIRFFVISSPPDTLLGNNMVLYENYAPNLNIDYNYYVNVVLKSKIYSLFDLGFKDALKILYSQENGIWSFLHDPLKFSMGKSSILQ